MDTTAAAALPDVSLDGIKAVDTSKVDLSMDESMAKDMPEISMHSGKRRMFMDKLYSISKQHVQEGREKIGSGRRKVSIQFTSEEPPADEGSQLTGTSGSSDGHAAKPETTFKVKSFEERVEALPFGKYLMRLAELSDTACGCGDDSDLLRRSKQKKSTRFALPNAAIIQKYREHLFGKQGPSSTWDFLYAQPDSFFVNGGESTFDEDTFTSGGILSTDYETFASRTYGDSTADYETYDGSYAHETYDGSYTSAYFSTDVGETTDGETGYSI